MDKKNLLDHVNYNVLDKAKAAFIQASKKTRFFAKKFGFIPDSGFGASANIFELDLKPFLNEGIESLHITLLPEGLGTSDDARPDDLTDQELEDFWHNIGIKTVAVMTNDAAASGMQTILISLYLPSSTPELVFNPIFMKGFLDGFTKACEEVGCVYFSGETPQLKGKIVDGKLDIAGALFGLVPAGKSPISGKELGHGDQIVLIESSGPHDNGFTALRGLAEKLPDHYRTKLLDENKKEIEYWRAINKPTHLYTPLIQKILDGNIQPTNVEPITGHGYQKLMRSEKHLSYVIENELPFLPIFKFVQEKSGVSLAEMRKIFNCGAGLAIFLKNKEEANKTVEIAKKNGFNAIVAGYVSHSSPLSIMNSVSVSGIFSLKDTAPYPGIYNIGSSFSGTLIAGSGASLIASNSLSSSIGQYSHYITGSTITGGSTCYSLSSGVALNGGFIIDSIGSSTNNLLGSTIGSSVNGNLSIINGTFTASTLTLGANREVVIANPASKSVLTDEEFTLTK